MPRLVPPAQPAGRMGTATQPTIAGDGLVLRPWELYMAALSHWALGEFGLHRIELEHSVTNETSCRVALTAGYPAEGVRRARVRYADGWHDMHLHARITE